MQETGKENMKDDVWDSWGLNEEPVRETIGALVKSITAFKSFAKTSIADCGRIHGMDNATGDRSGASCSMSPLIIPQQGLLKWHQQLLFTENKGKLQLCDSWNCSFVTPISPFSFHAFRWP